MSLPGAYKSDHPEATRRMLRERFHVFYFGCLKAKPPAICVAGGFCGESDDDLLSRTCVHYHRRGLVSRSCSGWEGVVPRRYVRQTVTCSVRREFRAERQRGRSVCWVVRLRTFFESALFCKVIGSSLTGN